MKKQYILMNNNILHSQNNSNYGLHHQNNSNNGSHNQNLINYMLLYLLCLQTDLAFKRVLLLYRNIAVETLRKRSDFLSEFGNMAN